MKRQNNMMVFAVNVGRSENFKERLCADLLSVYQAVMFSHFAETAKMNPLIMDRFLQVLC